MPIDNRRTNQKFVKLDGNRKIYITKEFNGFFLWKFLCSVLLNLIFIFRQIFCSSNAAQHRLLKKKHSSLTYHQLQGILSRIYLPKFAQNSPTLLNRPWSINSLLSSCPKYFVKKNLYVCPSSREKNCVKFSEVSVLSF